MRAEFRWKLGLIIALVLISAIVLYPPITARIAQVFGSPDSKGIFGGQPIRQGLDLRGGMEIILGPDYRVNLGILDQVGATLAEWVAKVQVASPTVGKLGLMELNKYDGLKLTFASADDAERVMASGVIKDELTLRDGSKDVHLILRAARVGSAIEVNVTQSEKDFPADAMARAETIITDRVNRLGLTEPDIRLDEEHQRIIVQLPSVTSEKEAEDILQRTGRLNFRMDGRVVLFGDDLRMAKAGYEGGQPIIHFEFGPSGAKTFAYLTRAENKGKKMGMYLDEEMLMEPEIQEPIPDGKGIIRLGRSTIEEAKKYAILMEAGSLPISLRNLSVNQVAPTLGKEIVRQSVVAGVAGVVLVIAFMIAFYGLVGVLADLALVLYAALVLVVLALFRGVLTLPGVAGFILSIGMAVDANIIIFERIKDELRSGKRMRPAVDSGFKRAFWTIFDSNLTTMIIAGVLLFYGYGAVRGFAITLGIGILVSMFTALFVTRYFLEMMIDRNPDRFVGHFRV
ncbi:MAG: protein translocase subunit SecD [Patescibacteria group bacterium]